MSVSRMNRCTKLLGLTCLASLFSLPASVVNASEANPLFNPFGTHRLILVCLSDVPDEAIAPLSKTYNALDWHGFDERDLLVLEIQDDKVYLVKQDELSWRRLEQTKIAPNLSRRANCQGDLEFVLIGKDGGEKMRWQGNLPRRALFDTIDAMPMRQYEMRQSEKRRVLR